MQEDKKYTLHFGKSEEVLKQYPDNHFDSVVTDPPYHLTSIVKRFGGENAAPAQFGKDGAFSRASRGFMGKEWDGGDIAFRPEFWAEILRVLKPGGHMVAFSGSRTYHRMACGIEDAGFEIRDQIMWLYGSGFPKSHNLSGDWDGWGSALKPAHEPIVLARKPLIGSIAANVLTHGTGALNIDGCRIETDELTPRNNSNSATWGTYGSGYAEPSKLGRWPANVIHDGSEEVVDGFPAEIGESASRFFYCAKASKEDRDEGLEGFELRARKTLGNGVGGQPDQDLENNKNTHPTVKPTDLMRYLCRLITPPGGLILDPFMGSGSTGKAAILEGFQFVGIDMTEEYIGIAEARIQNAYNQKHDMESLIRHEAAHSEQRSLFD